MTDFTEFEDWLYAKFSMTTIKETVRKMKYLDRHMDLESREAIMGFLRLERRNGATKQKLNSYIKYLNRWLLFSKQDKLEYLPEAKAKSFRKKAFDADQVKALKNSRGPTIEDKRNHAMVLLALNTGLRRSEICNLKIEDVHRYYLTVQREKGEKNHDVYLDEETRTVILEYAAMRNNPSSPYLFTTRKGSITPEYMGNIAQDIKRKTGVREFSWHKCRHTYAKNMIRNDVDLETLRQMLGHGDLDSTAIYLHPQQLDAIERAKKIDLFGVQNHPELHGMDRRGFEPRASSMPRKRSTSDLPALLP